MLDTQEFGDFLQSLGLSDFVGVPCSYLSPLINYAINEDLFIMANNEGDGVAIASGISISGANIESNKRKYGIVLMQNSGLSNALSPLTSLNDTFNIPILGFVSLRGQRDSNGINTDEPQHELLGIITDKILATCNIDYAFLDSNIDNAKKQVLSALEILQQNKSFFFIVKDKTFNKVKLCKNPLDNIESNANQTSNIGDCTDKEIANINNINDTCSKNTSLPTRLQSLSILHSLAKDSNCILLATTGKCGRELYEIGDSRNQLYMVGSMGCVSSLALGISLKIRQKLIAIDGDSALLMRMGALTTNAFYTRNNNNFCHVLLDNQSHDSTGGQFNLSPFVDFANIACKCGYANVYVANNIEEFEILIKNFISNDTNGAYFIYLKISKGSKENLGRPKITPKEVVRRLEKFIVDFK